MLRPRARARTRQRGHALEPGQRASRPGPLRAGGHPPSRGGQAGAPLGRGVLQLRPRASRPRPIGRRAHVFRKMPRDSPRLPRLHVGPRIDAFDDGGFRAWFPGLRGALEPGAHAEAPLSPPDLGRLGPRRANDRRAQRARLRRHDPVRSLRAFGGGTRRHGRSRSSIATLASARRRSRRGPPRP